MTPQLRSAFAHRGTRLFLSLLTLGAIWLLAAGKADAQTRTFYLDRLQLGGAPQDGYGVWRPRMNEETVFYGQWAVGWQHRPLRGSTAAPNDRVASRTENPVQNQISSYFNVGIEVLERASIGVGLPVVLYQHGLSPCPYGSPETCENTSEDPTVPGDTRVDARVILYRPDSRRFHLGLAGSLWIPSGQTKSFTSDGATTGALDLLAEYDFGKVILVGNSGVHFRPTRSLNQLHIGNEWTWRAGVYLPLRENRLRLGATIFGSTGIGKAGETDTTFTGRNTPIEWLGEGRLALDKKKMAWAGVGAGTRLSTGYGAPDVRVLANIGYSFSIQDSDPNSPGRRFDFDLGKEPGYADKDKDGIPDDLDLCPTVPEDGADPDPSDGCPAASDRDKDGIPDETDKCPDEPEDKDGIEDDDGCPEDDFDQDGVLDVEDKCPREPGEASPDPERNGCPKFIRRVEGSTEIQILKKVEFGYNSATILPGSFPILDEVGALLKANTDIKRINVEGHTDNRGPHYYNMRLSRDRAQSVVKYLVEHGIEAARLSSQGYGPDKPLDSNDTDAGRQKNRRVEFHIVEQN